ncbi:MAG: DUF1266 domain-containing protein [Clostridiales Family XIII bacterium]|jgi:hypothetical protein|nr:DUF1266 domain-containing protein [Clostridiales Family XIII bacterium]
MGFFKELIEAIKEGRAEAKEELAQEAAKQEASKKSDEAERTAFLDSIPYGERFGMALAAPFRVSVFLDWFTVWKNDDHTDDEFPRHLYAISPGGLLQKSDLKALKKALARDFSISDESSALCIIGQIFDGGAIPSATEFPEYDRKTTNYGDYARPLYGANYLDEDGRKNGLTLVANMAAHAVAGSVDLGYITLDVGLSLLRDVGAFVKSLYGPDGSWAEYGTRFLAANDIFELNDKKAMELLGKYVHKLCEKPGSPWVNVPFYIDGENITPFEDLVDPPIFPEL